MDMATFLSTISDGHQAVALKLSDYHTWICLVVCNKVCQSNAQELKY